MLSSVLHRSFENSFNDAWNEFGDEDYDGSNPQVVLRCQRIVIASTFVGALYYLGEFRRPRDISDRKTEALKGLIKTLLDKQNDKKPLEDLLGSYPALKAENNVILKNKDFLTQKELSLIESGEEDKIDHDYFLEISSRRECIEREIAILLEE